MQMHRGHIAAAMVALSVALVSIATSGLLSGGIGSVH